MGYQDNWRRIWQVILGLAAIFSCIFAGLSLVKSGAIVISAPSIASTTGQFTVTSETIIVTAEPIIVTAEPIIVTAEPIIVTAEPGSTATELSFATLQKNNLAQNVPCIATEQGPLAQTNHTFEGPIHIVQLWRQNGQSPWGTGEVMAVVSGNVSILSAGGNVWTYPSLECEEVTYVHMQDSAYQRGSTIVTEAELRDANLIE